MGSGYVSRAREGSRMPAQRKEAGLRVRWGTTGRDRSAANGWGNARTSARDNIIIKAMEHHANIVPGRCCPGGAELRVILLNQDGNPALDAIPACFDERTCLLAITRVLTCWGTENPVAALIRLSPSQHGAKVLAGRHRR